MSFTQNFNELIKQFKNSKNTEKDISNYIEENFKEFKNEIDYENEKQRILDLIKTIQSIESIKSEEETEIIFSNTLKQFNYDFKEEQIEVFKELIKYDKSCISENKKVFYRLSELLNIIFNHTNALVYLNEIKNSNDIIKKGIAQTNHPKVSEAIKPRIEEIKKYQLLNKTDSSNMALNIYEEFDKNPLEINAMYAVIHNMDRNTLLEKNKEKVDTLFNQAIYFNSAKKLKDTHIFKSCQIYTYGIYKKQSLIDMQLKSDKHIPYSTLATYTNILMESFFDYEFNSNIAKKHIDKKIQFKTYFNSLELLEYRTKSNYQEHPIFKNV